MYSVIWSQEKKILTTVSIPSRFIQPTLAAVKGNKRPVSSYQHISTETYSNLCQLQYQFSPHLTASKLDKGAIISLKGPKPALGIQTMPKLYI